MPFILGFCALSAKTRKFLSVYGGTCSYGELAARLGKPGAARAVGAANRRNPIAIIIPCHRVIGADGSLTGYGGGLEIKRWLLELERRVLATDGSLSRP